MDNIQITLTESTGTVFVQQAVQQLYAHLKAGTVSHKDVDAGSIEIRGVSLDPEYSEAIKASAVSGAVKAYEQSHVHEEYKDTSSRRPGEDGWLKR